MQTIHFDKISFTYNKDLIHEKFVDLAINACELTAVTGPNGSGKTTVGKLATGILRPDHGRVYYDKTDIAGLTLAQIGEKTGYLFQEPRKQLFTATVMQELTFAPFVNRQNKDSAECRARELLSRFNLLHLADRFPFTLSRGEQQRLALAAILINSPTFLVLDEPTTALDLKCKKEFELIIKALLTEGTGILIISHDTEFLARLSHRRLVMGDDLQIL